MYSALDAYINTLGDTNDFLSLCVKLWRLGDYFRISTLTAKIYEELGVFLDQLLMEFCSSYEDYTYRTSFQSVKQTLQLVQAVKEAYRDDQTKSLQGMLTAFFWSARHSGLLGDPKVGAVMDRVPAFGRDILKAPTQRHTPRLPWLPTTGGTLRFDRPMVLGDMECAECYEQFDAIDNVGLYNPFLVETLISNVHCHNQDRAWCVDCALKLRCRNDVPWRRDAK